MNLEFEVMTTTERQLLDTPLETGVAAMKQRIAASIETCIQQDPGGRGIDHWACQAELLPATLSLFDAHHIVITTGFYILSAGAIETDGPPGAIILANALQKMGKSVSILVDDHAATIIRRGLDYIGSDVELIQIRPGQPIDIDSVIRADTTHFVAIERPGQSKDGCYYNFAGKDISAYVSPVDNMFIRARSMGIVTIGVGDGGNELGMQIVADKVDDHLRCHPPISCQVGADYCICAGVSNWGGYAIAGLLSHLAGKNLMPPVEQLVRLLQEIVLAGAVDGISAKQDETVDGLDPTWEYGIYTRVWSIVSR
jgi:hypothetical protein